MKIKRIKLQNNAFFGNTEFQFTDDNDHTLNNIVLAGKNGCGKTQLLNIIYEFSNLPLRGDVRNEINTFTVMLSQEELQQINQSLDEQYKLVEPTGEMDITVNYQVQPGYWSRLKIEYKSQVIHESTNIKTIDSSHLFSRADIKSIFKSIFSTVEINYSPKDTSTVTSKEIDEEVTGSIRSGNDLASDIQQLFIDIQDSDAHELQVWVDNHTGQVPPESVTHRRINRFKDAFSTVFDNLNFSRVVTNNGKKKVYFQKDGQDIDIASLSSGEKQIVFRGAFLLRNQQSIKGSVVLIDEPEISLHPAWQMKIYDYYRKLFTENDGTQTSQLFIATHSQYVLCSALENHFNTLIVLLQHTNTNVNIKRINAPLVLPIITSAELNYVAFNIVSNDYHIQLFGYLQNKIAYNQSLDFCTVKLCDSYITQQPEYDPTKHKKTSSYTFRGQTTNYDTLPTYIRNAIDHPDPTRSFTQQELRTSIELLIKLCS